MNISDCQPSLSIKRTSSRNVATKKGPRKGDPSLGRNSNSILYFYQPILSEFPSDCDFTDVSHLIPLLRDCPPQEPLRLWEWPQWKRRTSIAVEVVVRAKWPFQLCDLEAGASLLISNQYLFQHCAFRWVCFGVIKGNVVRCHDAVLRFSALGGMPRRTSW